MKHVKTLLKRGFLPVSVDYRLCPEVTLVQGPITDAVDALAWARSTLPHLQRGRPDVHVDGNRVVAVGWSSGGHLAMTLAYAARTKGVLLPDTVVGFYGMSDLEAEYTVPYPTPFIVARIASRHGFPLEVTDRTTKGGSIPSISSLSRNRQTPSTTFWKVLVTNRCVSPKSDEEPSIRDGLLGSS